MDRKMLTVFTYGILELVVLLGYSFLLWLDIFEKGVTYLVVADCIILIIALTSIIWIFIFKHKARIYLIVNFIRYFILLLVIILSNLSVIFGESDMPEYRLISPFIIALFTFIYYYLNETKHWSEVIQVWQKIKKIDLDAKQFNIGVPNYLMTEGGEKNLKKAAMFYVPAWFLLSILDIFLGDDFKYFLLKIGSLFVACVFAFGAGKFAAWMVNFIKMEKEMHVEFITEYGDAKKMARLSR